MMITTVESNPDMGPIWFVYEVLAATKLKYTQDELFWPEHSLNSTFNFLQRAKLADINYPLHFHTCTNFCKTILILVLVQDQPYTYTKTSSYLHLHKNIHILVHTQRTSSYLYLHKNILFQDGSECCVNSFSDLR